MKLTEQTPDAQVTFERLLASGVGCSFFVVFIPTRYAKRKGASIEAGRKLFDLIDAQCSEYDELVKVQSVDEMRNARADGQIGIAIGVEGGHIIEDSLEVLAECYERGARYLTLTHTDHTNWADSSTKDPKHGGLTAFGREVVREMNRLGMLVDVSHVSDDTFDHALEESKVPVIASHSSCRTLADHPRNLTDRMLRDLAEKRGVCMINFFSSFVEPEAARVLMNAPSSGDRPRYDDEVADEEAYWSTYTKWYGQLKAPLGDVDTVVDHIVHAASIAGVEAVGIGSDFDGAPAFPSGLETIDRFPILTQRLLERSFSEKEIAAIYGENFLRVFSETEAFARQQVD